MEWYLGALLSAPAGVLGLDTAVFQYVPDGSCAACLQSFPQETAQHTKPPTAAATLIPAPAARQLC